MPRRLTSTAGESARPAERSKAAILTMIALAGSRAASTNGGYFGLPRSKRVCWPTTCANGVDASECGSDSSVCGKNCGGVVVCDPANPLCPSGETCKAGLEQLFGVQGPGVCVDPSCPSNDPAKCGTETSLCGKQCICTPDCSAATAANPDDGCGGDCPHLCPMGQACCKTDLNCPVAAFCQAQPSGAGICRPQSCAFQRLQPPLCGSASAPCGQQCEVCTPQCDGRQCGLEAKCETSCGTCESGKFCDGSGQCLTPSSDPPIQIQAFSLGGDPIDLPNLPEASTTPVGALSGRFGVSDEGERAVQRSDRCSARTRWDSSQSSRSATPAQSQALRPASAGSWRGCLRFYVALAATRLTATLRLSRATKPTAFALMASV